MTNLIIGSSRRYNGSNYLLDSFDGNIACFSIDKTRAYNYANECNRLYGVNTEYGFLFTGYVLEGENKICSFTALKLEGFNSLVSESNIKHVLHGDVFKYKGRRFFAFSRQQNRMIIYGSSSNGLELHCVNTPVGWAITAQRERDAESITLRQVVEFGKIKSNKKVQK